MRSTRCAVQLCQCYLKVCHKIFEDEQAWPKSLGVFDVLSVNTDVVPAVIIQLITINGLDHFVSVDLVFSWLFVLYGCDIVYGKLILLLPLFGGTISTWSRWTMIFSRPVAIKNSIPFCTVVDFFEKFAKPIFICISSLAFTIPEAGETFDFTLNRDVGTIKFIWCCYSWLVQTLLLSAVMWRTLQLWLAVSLH